ncbi:hypothetical protein [Nonomuraea sp. NPDC002799]
MGRYASIDWIEFEWDERRTGLGPVRSSLEDTRVWEHELGPWLDPGPVPGSSVCRLKVNGRVVVLARTRTGGSDSRRTIQGTAYLGGSATSSSAMPNPRQALALAAGWAARPPGDREPLDLARLLDPFAEARDLLDRQARAGAGELAPIVSQALRGPREALSVASHGNTVVQLWGLMDILHLVLGRCPETFSTYESDDLKRGAEVIFLRQWPGLSSQGSHRARVDLRAPEQDDAYGEVAALVVEAYADGRLPALVKRLGITGGTPAAERIRLLANSSYEPAAPAAQPDQVDTWAPRPRQRQVLEPANPTPAPPPSPQPSPAPPTARPHPVAHAPGPPSGPPPGRASGSPSGPASGSPAASRAEAGPSQPEIRPPAPSFATRDVFEDFRADLADAATSEETRAIMKDVRDWAATRTPAEVRSRLPVLIADLERLLPESQVNRVLLDVLDPEARAEEPRSGWLDPRWIVLAAGLGVVLVLQVVLLVFR